MKRIVLLFFSLTLLFLPACAEEPDLPVQEESDFQRTDVINYRTALYGDYIYSSDLRVERCNWKTGEVTRGCGDPNCNTCPLEMQAKMGPIVDNKLYFCANAIRATKGAIYACLDLTTDEVKVLLSIPRAERGDIMAPILEDGWLYYIAQHLPEGADAADPDAYLPYVGRLPMEGGDTEFVCDIEAAPGEWLRAVVDGKVITELARCLYITDPETNERKVLFAPEEHGLKRDVEYMHFLSGSLYFLCHTGESMEYRSGEYSERAGIYHLFKLDTQTGELKQISDEPMDSFTLTDDTVYYYKKEIRIFYLPEDYKLYGGIRRTHSSATVYACDLDGSNIREVFTDPYLRLWLYPRTVIDGCLWSGASRYSEEERKWSDMPFSKIDFTTRQIIPASFLN